MKHRYAILTHYLHQAVITPKIKTTFKRTTRFTGGSPTNWSDFDTNSNVVTHATVTKIGKVYLYQLHQ